jgi:hypothetical protein
LLGHLRDCIDTPAIHGNGEATRGGLPQKTYRTALLEKLAKRKLVKRVKK